MRLLSGVPENTDLAAPPRYESGQLQASSGKEMDPDSCDSGTTKLAKRRADVACP